MSVLRDLVEVGQEALAIGLGEVTVELRTNYLPAIRIPTSRGDGQSENVLGIRGGLIIRNQRGEILETIGDPVPVDPLRFAAVLSLAGAAVFVIARGVLK